MFGDPLEDAGVEQTRPVLPVIGIPILESATIEEDESLHTAWAKLLANAMNPSKPEIKRSFCGILSGLEPFDVTLLELILGVSAAHEHSRALRFSKQKIEAKFRNELSKTDRIWTDEPGGSFMSITEGSVEDEHVGIKNYRNNTDGQSDETEVSLQNLIRLGLLTYGQVENEGMNMGGYNLIIYRGIEEVSVTALGIEFFKAVKA